MAGRLGHIVTRSPARRRRQRSAPLLITISGMDGAGKSTAAAVIDTRLRAAGLPAEIVWARIGGESALLNRLATPVKRVLRRSGTVADPVAAGDRGSRRSRTPARLRGGAGSCRGVGSSSWPWPTRGPTGVPHRGGGAVLA